MSNFIGLSEFCRNYNDPKSGNSYTTLSDKELIACVEKNWDKRTPGTGETGIDRKVLVPVSGENFYCPPRIALTKDLPLKARVKYRQEGEDPYIEIYVTFEDAKKYGYKDIPAVACNVVCYSAEALQENNGTRSTDCEWEIITILAQNSVELEPMLPLTMARNFLEKTGGTKSVYSAKEFAEAIYYHSNRGVRVCN